MLERGRGGFPAPPLTAGAHMGFLDKLLGRKPGGDGNALHRTVRCRRCGSLIRVRIDVRNDLSLNDSNDGYFVRKTLVDDRCFSRIELEMTFDLNRRETGSDVRGGTLEAADQG
jgi:hypothetical protein